AYTRSHCLHSPEVPPPTYTLSLHDALPICSGTGKSVLIKIISGLLKPDKGQVIVLGKDVARLSTPELRELRQKIGFSFQHSALYDSMTVRENLEFPLVRNQRHLKRKQINQAIEEVLEAVGLSQAINQMPSELSGGQRK